jgi:hypothetical protein
MVKNLAVALGYAKAPRATFMLRHPRAGTAAYAFSHVLRESSTARKLTAGLVGLGAAAVALPTVAVLAVRSRMARKANAGKRSRVLSRPVAASRAVVGKRRSKRTK